MNLGEKLPLKNGLFAVGFWNCLNPLLRDFYARIDEQLLGQGLPRPMSTVLV